MNSNSTHWTCLLLSTLPARRRWCAVIVGVLVGLPLSLLWCWSTPARADSPVPLDPLPTWFSHDSDETFSAAWGDVDGDGDLDLAVGNVLCPHKVYLNQEGVLQVTAAWESGDLDRAMSVAWGDVDGDGDLDLAVGNVYGRNKVYLNRGDVLQTAADNPWITDDSDDTESVAWGDMNGDGYLDLAVGNRDQPNKVYLNEGGTLQVTAVWTDSITDTTRSVAWGDVDGDGDLDLAVGNDGQSNKVYLNEGGVLTTTNVWELGDSDWTWSVAWGDVDGDGDLDLATGNLGPNKVYLNQGDVLQPDANNPWTSDDSDVTLSVAWGDVDGDGDLDLAAGNGGFSGQPNKVYVNNGGVLQKSAGWVSDSSDGTWSVAWGDVDGDGNLDLVSAGPGQPNRVYRNWGSNLPIAIAWTADASGATQSVAWGDMNGDGALDLAVGNDGKSNKVYLNEGGTLQATAVWTDSITDATFSVAWGDVDGDGDLDLAAGNGAFSGEPNRVYLNEGETLTTTNTWQSDDSDQTASVAWGDVDGDGDLDLAVGNVSSPNRVYVNQMGVLEETATWASDDDDWTWSVAWGDMDGDGDLDLATGNAYGPPNKVYLNQGGTLERTAAWTSDDRDETWSVAWGDVDGDGDLDLAAGNAYGSNKVYLNHGGMLEKIATWFSSESDRTHSVAWGDVDGDGDLDLAAGNYGLSEVYLNEGGTLQIIAARTAGGGNTRSVAWGDVDGDGDLDLAIGNDAGQWNNVYLNQRPAFPLLPGQAAGMALGLNSGPVQTFSQTVTTLAPADFYAVPGVRQAGTVPITYTLFNPSGDPMQSVRGFYSPDGGGRWYTAKATNTVTTNLATGRMDIFAAHTGLPLPIPVTGAVSATLLITEAYEIADLDVWLVITHTFNPDLAVYLQSPSGASVELFSAVAYGGSDFDRTWLSDQAATSIIIGTPPYTGTYRPEGRLADFNGATTNGTWTLVITDSTPSNGGTLLEWGLRVRTPSPPHVYTWDVLGSGFFGQSDNVVFRLEAFPLPSHSSVTGTYRYTNTIPGPYQRPLVTAQTYPFRARGTQVQVLSGTVSSASPISNAMIYRLPKDQLLGFVLADKGDTPFRTDQHGYLQGRGQIAVSDTLLALVPVHTALNYAGVLELDREDGADGDQYVIKNPLNNAPVTETTVSFWMRSEDTTGSGTLLSYATSGDDDELLITDYNYFVIRRGGSYVSTGVSATDGFWHHIAVTWRSSDGQVKLYKDGVAAFTGTLTTAPIVAGGSLVLGQDQDSVGGGFETWEAFEGSLDEVRIWNTALTEAQILDDILGIPGRDEPGLVLYWDFDDPDIPASGQCKDRSGNGNHGAVIGAEWLGDYLGGYTVYHTSGTPTEDSVQTHIVSEPGVQIITVTAQHPLVLFDIDLSLEWDASNDPVYLQQLELDLRRASKHLYDFSDGQVALGHVNVFQNGDNWATSHVLVHATNRLRPFAAQGGITLTATVDPEHDDIVYGPGQVHMGATWNRYGTPGQNIGVDWPLILAHELSHYFLFLDDVYIGLDDDGLLVSVDTCTRSAMGDVYDPANTEFIHDDAHWATNCADTLAARTLERDEWQTIELWYPWLVTPVITNTGPSRMPFDFISVTILDPVSPTDTLEDPTFYLDYANDAVSSSEARAYLLRGESSEPLAGADDFQYVYDLGSPTGGQNRVLARGAQPGDRLCVFDRSRAQYGCEVIQDGDDHLALEKNQTWTPVVQLSPVNSTTFGIQVTGLVSHDLSLKARLYPEYGPAFTVTALSYVSAIQAYSTTLHLAYPSMVGHVQLWVDETTEPAETDPRPETIVAFTIGGNPGITRGSGGITRGSGGITRGSGGITRGSGGITRGSGGITRGSGAPLVSPDGQMIFFTENPLIFDEGQFFTVQSMADLPSLPPGRTLVGQGYNLVASPSITRPITGSISIQYLGTDVLVAGVDEDDLSLYFWDGDRWTELDTVLDTYYNLASTPSQGPGVYALLASVRIPLHGAGWNLVSYPLPGSQPVTHALRSISGTYAIVYGYVVTDTADPWRVHGVGAPAYVNRLHKLQFGQGYWISVTRPITWYLGRGSDPLAAGDVQAAQNMESPPATYYGPLLAGQGFTPTAGMAMSAWISGKLCGQGRTLEVGGEVVYSVHVSADGPGGASGCGEPGRYVTFKVKDRTMWPATRWDNGRLWEIPLTAGYHVYLPLIVRE